MTTPNQCRFWNCAEIIRRDHFLCYDHYTGHQEGRIDKCPQCNRYRGANYPVCRNCERQPAAPQRGFARPSAGIAEPEARYYQPAAALLGSANYAALLEELRDLRRNLARTHRLQDFMVFSNDTLEQLAQIRPANEREMQAFSGVGPVKMERFGWGFLRVINAYVSAPPARESRRPAAAATVERDDREFAADKDADAFSCTSCCRTTGNTMSGKPVSCMSACASIATIRAKAPEAKARSSSGSLRFQRAAMRPTWKRNSSRCAPTRPAAGKSTAGLSTSSIWSSGWITSRIRRRLRNQPRNAVCRTVECRRRHPGAGVSSVATHIRAIQLTWTICRSNRARRVIIAGKGTAKRATAGIGLPSSGCVRS